MSHIGARSWGTRCTRRLAPWAAAAAAALAVAPGAAFAAPPVAADVVAGAQLKSGPAPLPDLMPFKVAAAATTPPAAEAPVVEAAAPSAFTTHEVLLAGAAVLAFVALRHRG